MNTLSHTRLAPPLSEILQAGTLCTFRTLKTVFFANVGRLSTSLDPTNVHTNDGVLCSLVRIYNSKQFYDLASSCHVLAAAHILCGIDKTMQ